ncbi:hypothetical protein EVC03_008 [Rhizobium phage RHph_Y5A]|nr:hypothetical protein EVC03_008 [Rhizobium phage RHph_Y5A]QIG75450.1 hypothetical protein EVC18_008 [Rhizobium phage RHph_Y2_4]
MNVNDWITAVRDGVRLNRALVIQGGRGSGKTVAVELLKATFPTLSVSTLFDSSILRRFENGAHQVTTHDIVVFDHVFCHDQLDVIKPIITESEIPVDVRGVGREVRTIKANVIVTAEFFPHDPAERRFIVTTPIELIASLIPFLAR